LGHDVPHFVGAHDDPAAVGGSFVRESSQRESSAAQGYRSDVERVVHVRQHVAASFIVGHSTGGDRDFAPSALGDPLSTTASVEAFVGVLSPLATVAIG
jgi:hypothetical protein